MFCLVWDPVLSVLFLSSPSSRRSRFPGPPDHHALSQAPCLPRRRRGHRADSPDSCGCGGGAARRALDHGAVREYESRGSTALTAYQPPADGGGLRAHGRRRRGQEKGGCLLRVWGGGVEMRRWGWSEGVRSRWGDRKVGVTWVWGFGAMFLKAPYGWV